MGLTLFSFRTSSVIVSMLALACTSVPEERPTTTPPQGSGISEPGSETVIAATALYSEGQADRGRAVFSGVCSECHYSSEFRGRQFQFAWRRRSVGDLFDHVSETMPEDAPGSLEPGQYADVVAYILRLNGAEPGPVELLPDPSALKAYGLGTLFAN